MTGRLVDVLHPDPSSSVYVDIDKVPFPEELYPHTKFEALGRRQVVVNGVLVKSATRKYVMLHIHDTLGSPNPMVP